MSSIGSRHRQHHPLIALGLVLILGLRIAGAALGELGAGAAGGLGAEGAERHAVIAAGELARAAEHAALARGRLVVRVLLPRELDRLLKE